MSASGQYQSLSITLAGRLVTADTVFKTEFFNSIGHKQPFSHSMQFENRLWSTVVFNLGCIVFLNMIPETSQDETIV